MTLLFVVLAPFLGLLLPPLFQSKGRSACAFAAALPGIVALILILQYLNPVLSGEIIRVRWNWIPALGLSFSLRLDGLALLFALLILGIGLLIILYARYYMASDDRTGLFYSLILAFMGSMLGIVISGNLLLLLMFWEMTTLCSFLLIGFWPHKEGSRKGAQTALILTGAGGLALMAGILLIGQIVGSFELDTVLQSGDLIREHALYPLLLILILLGAFIKSAQFPFHFWLPQAMAAPTPVSAYLHSATMVKAGVFLLARLHPALGGTDLWFLIVTFTGLVTLLAGAIKALTKYDLKSLLAYSTISHLGLVMMLFGLDTPVSAVAGILHIINHAIFKASLFMAAGIIDHETGSRDLRKISGLWKYMPETATLAIVAALSMAGVPLLNGFISKEMFFAESLKSDLLGGSSWLIPLMATLAGMFSVAYSVRFVFGVFFNGPPKSLPKFPPHEPPLYMKIPVAVLVGLCLLVGIMPDVIVGTLLASATQAVLGGELPDYKLAVLHGFNLPLLMSVISLLGGWLIYKLWQRLHKDDYDETQYSDVLFQDSINKLIEFSGHFIGWLDNGSLQRYVTLLLLTVVVTGAFTLMPLSDWQGPVGLAKVDAVTAIGGLILGVAAVTCVMVHRQRFIALIMLSVTGLMVSLGFARFSAPDLAMTQISVEVVTTVLFMLALYFLPQTTSRETTIGRRIQDLSIAGVLGIGAACLTYAILTRPYESISGFFLSRAKSEAGGANVVNVILTDFRALDTLGEVTVLAIAALGAVALVKNLEPRAREYEAVHRIAPDVFPRVVQVASRPLLPMTLMVALFILLRGHNMPGGGFIAGLMVAVALILQYIANGAHWAQKRMPISYWSVIASGLFIIALTGIGPWIFNHPFLTSWFTHVKLPILGEFELATAMLFDIGVFLTVTGSTLLILAELGHVVTTPKEQAE